MQINPELDQESIDLPRLRGDLREAGAEFGGRTGTAKLLAMALERELTVYGDDGEEIEDAFLEEDADEADEDSGDAEGSDDAEAAAEDEEDEDKGGNIVPEKYRKKYGTPQHCGDEMALVFKDTVTVSVDGKDECSEAELIRIADQNGVDIGRWAHLNKGQRRMNLGNVLRGRLKRGERVEIGSTVWEAVPKADDEDADTASTKMG